MPPHVVLWLHQSCDRIELTLAAETLTRSERRGIFVAYWVGQAGDCASMIQDADLREYCTEFVLFPEPAAQECVPLFIMEVPWIKPPVWVT